MVGTMALGMVLLAATAGVAASSAAPLEEPVATAPAGTFRGFVQNGTRTWRGIPYAEPPIGPRRWKVTVPKKKLSVPLSTKSFGATCAQLGPGWPSLGGMIKNCHNYMHGCPNMTWGKATSEDCLFLNVYSPVQDSTQPNDDTGLPVVVRLALAKKLSLSWITMVCFSAVHLLPAGLLSERSFRVGFFQRPGEQRVP